MADEHKTDLATSGDQQANHSSIRYVVSEEMVTLLTALLLPCSGVLCLPKLINCSIGTQPDWSISSDLLLPSLAATDSIFPHGSLSLPVLQSSTLTSSDNTSIPRAFESLPIIKHTSPPLDKSFGKNSSFTLPEFSTISKPTKKAPVSVSPTTIKDTASSHDLKMASLTSMTTVKSSTKLTALASSRKQAGVAKPKKSKRLIAGAVKKPRLSQATQNRLREARMAMTSNEASNRHSAQASHRLARNSEKGVHSLKKTGSRIAKVGRQSIVGATRSRVKPHTRLAPSRGELTSNIVMNMIHNNPSCSLSQYWR